MRRPFLLTATVVVAAALVRLAPACLEVTPIIVEKEAAVASAGCLACLEQPDRCRPLIDSCHANPRCEPVYQCMSRDKCLDLPTLDDKIGCGLPCAAEAGITRLDDPIVKDYLVALVGCAREKCVEPCNLVDASLGL